MISARRLAANRRNAQFSTGPRTPAGKARAAQNARRHGFRTALTAGAEVSAEAAALARRMAGERAGAQTLALAGCIAQAQLDLARIRRARTMLLARHGVSPRLAALDRYERYVLTRRRRAIGAFDALGTPAPRHFARTKPPASTALRSPQRTRPPSAVFARTNPSFGHTLASARSSWPGLSRPSTSFVAAKTWMPGT